MDLTKEARSYRLSDEDAATCALLRGLRNQKGWYTKAGQLKPGALEPSPDDPDRVSVNLHDATGLGLLLLLEGPSSKVNARKGFAICTRGAFDRVRTQQHPSPFPRVERDSDPHDRHANLDFSGMDDIQRAFAVTHLVVCFTVYERGTVGFAAFVTKSNTDGEAERRRRARERRIRWAKAIGITVVLLGVVAALVTLLAR